MRRFWLIFLLILMMPSYAIASNILSNPSFSTGTGTNADNWAETNIERTADCGRNGTSDWCMNYFYDPLFADAFDSDGWTETQITGSVDAGIYYGQITNISDPYIYKTVNFSSTGTVLKLTYKGYTNGPNGLTIYWKNATCAAYSGTCAQSFTNVLTKDGNWVTLYIVITDTDWTGTITGLRLDFDNAVTTGEFNLDYIGIAPAGSFTSDSYSAVSYSTVKVWGYAKSTANFQVTINIEESANGSSWSTLCSRILTTSSVYHKVDTGDCAISNNYVRAKLDGNGSFDDITLICNNSACQSTPTWDGSGSALSITSTTDKILALQWTKATDSDGINYRIWWNEKEGTTCSTADSGLDFGSNTSGWKSKILTPTEVSCNADSTCNFTVPGSGPGLTFCVAVQAVDVFGYGTVFSSSDTDSDTTTALTAPVIHDTTSTEWNGTASNVTVDADLMTLSGSNLSGTYTSRVVDTGTTAKIAAAYFEEKIPYQDGWSRWGDCLTKGVMLDLHFEEASGATATNDTGCGRHGTIVGTMGFSTASKLGNGYTLSGDDYITIPYDASYDVNDTNQTYKAFQIIAVVRQPATPSATEYILSTRGLESGGTRNEQITFHVDTSGYVVCHVRDNANNEATAISTTAIGDNAWHVVGCAWDTISVSPAKVAVRIDNTEWTVSASALTSTISTQKQWIIGAVRNADSSYTGHFSGDIDELYFWNGKYDYSTAPLNLWVMERAYADLKLQIKVCNTISGNDCTDGIWQGPDGTASTYFDEPQKMDISQLVIGRYIQYKVLLDRDNTLVNPELNAVKIIYEDISDTSWFDTDYQKRYRVNIDTSALVEPSYNGVVKVILSSSNFDFTLPQTNGCDIRFTDSSRTNEIKDFWIQDYDSTAQEATIWIRVSGFRVTTTNLLYMYVDSLNTESCIDDVQTVFHIGDDTEYRPRDISNLQPYTSNPVLSEGSSGQWDYTHISKNHVIYDTQYKQYYASRQGTESDPYPNAIGLATSSDGLTFTKDGTNPIFEFTDLAIPSGSVMATDCTGATGAEGVHEPTVIKESSTYYLFHDCTQATQNVGYLSSSTTGNSNWNVMNDYIAVLPLGPSGAWDAKRAIFQDIKKYDGLYMGIYRGNRISAMNNQYCVGIAFSTDLITWVKYKKNPVSCYGGNGDWDRDAVSRASFIKENGKYYMLSQTGQRDAFHMSQIMGSTSDDFYAWRKLNKVPTIFVWYNDSTKWNNYYYNAVSIVPKLGDSANGYYIYAAADNYTGRDKSGLFTQAPPFVLEIKRTESTATVATDATVYSANSSSTKSIKFTLSGPGSPSSDYLNYGRNMRSMSEFVMEFDVRLSHATAAAQTDYYLQFGSAYGNMVYPLSFSGQTSGVIKYLGTGGWTNYPSNNTFSANTWYHMKLAWRDNGLLDAYKDGATMGTSIQLNGQGIFTNSFDEVDWMGFRMLRAAGQTYTTNMWIDNLIVYPLHDSTYPTTVSEDNSLVPIFYQISRRGNEEINPVTH